MGNRLLLTGLLLFASGYSFAQVSINGKIIEAADTAGLIGVNVFVAPVSDTSQKNGTVTDADGNFYIDNITPGQYRLHASYIGFTPHVRTITINDQNINLGTIALQPAASTLQTVVVQGQAVQATQIGDTTQFNASSFKTHPDANAEDLVTKMPGVTRDEGTLKVNGEEVSEILVDGKPFFGDDPNAAVKNLPAEIIDKVQVFDKLSDQDQFTGFNQGETRKTINIITKPGKNAGKFGKVYAGYGTDDRYNVGGNINFFKGARRITVLGLSNNINQQNFSSDDLLGVTANLRSQNRGGGGPRGGGPGGSEGRGGSGGFRGGNRGGDGSNFLVTQQGGIVTTSAIGLNYSDEWGKKIKVSSSYFFNHTNTDNTSTITRQYVNTDDSNLVYDENSFTNARNINHRLNGRLEYTIDSANSLIITPRISFQDAEYGRILNGNNTQDGLFFGRTVNSDTSDNSGYNFSNNILYRHRFAKKGRTISFNFGTQLNDKLGDGQLFSLNEFADGDTSLLDQQYHQTSGGYTLSGNLNYTEPLSKKSQLMVNYAPSYTNNDADKESFNLNPADGQYNVLNPTLSNKFDNTYLTQRGGLSYRYNDTNYNFNVGVDGQIANLEGHQTYPTMFDIDRSFRNILPNAMFNYRFSRNKNLRIMYRSGTNAPSITQLQNVVDISNPLLLKTGNPSLVQDYDHNLIARYSATNTRTSRSFFVFGNAQFTQDYIGNATFIPTKDTVINSGFLVNRGTQINMPVNLDGYMNARIFATYAFPVKAIKSNLSLNGGVGYSHTPAIINNERNFSNNYTTSAGFTLGSNINENLDFTLSYRGNYNIVKNTLQTDLDNTYYYHTAGLRLNYVFLERFVFNTDATHNLYTGLTQDFNQSFLLWNAALGYKFLKDRSLDLRLSVYDILNQNRAISRTVTETYIEDSFTNVLQRYFMLTLTYTLRNFASGKTSNPELNQPR
ncbi:TonB-dependent receptor [Polluticoccus soli]|uniref:TonB-dependent receptor n=1 Tax=Polluticoccus soli TaxID=3034150 RepID=UPI0023E2EBE8|nr:TonB-dependent receptor [Flavipsychrobacter sp. JY13-12]